MKHQSKIMAVQLLGNTTKLVGEMKLKSVMK